MNKQTTTLLTLGYALVAIWFVTIGCQTPVPLPIPTTTTTTIPPDTRVPGIVQLPGANVNYADLQEVATITKCNFDGRNLDIGWIYSKPWTDQGDEYCDKVICFFDPRSGRAAYLEYVGENWTDHNFNSIGDNLENGHGDLEMKSGDTIYFWLCGWKNASQRSQLYRTRIP